MNWPSQYQAGMGTGYYAARTPQLARLASDIFSRHRCFDNVNEVFADFDTRTYLEVVAFGVRDRDYRMLEPMYFLQSEVFVLKQKKMHAERVSLKFLAAQKMGGDVVDYDKRDFDQNSRSNIGYYPGQDAAPMTAW